MPSVSDMDMDDLLATMENIRSQLRAAGTPVEYIGVHPCDFEHVMEQLEEACTVNGVMFPHAMVFGVPIEPDETVPPGCMRIGPRPRPLEARRERMVPPIPWWRLKKTYD